MEKITISEMSKLHGISRQTLIYYDMIGLFKPESVDSNGYRYYSWRQIPLLREICFLKEAGMPLKEVIERLGKRTIHGELESLLEQKNVLSTRLESLTDCGKLSLCGCMLTLPKKRPCVWKLTSHFS